MIALGVSIEVPVKWHHSLHFTRIPVAGVSIIHGQNVQESAAGKPENIVIIALHAEI